MIEVLDNILTVEEQDELENLVKSETFREGNNVYWLNDSNDYNNKDGDYKPHNAIIYIPDENIGQFTANLKNKAIEKLFAL